MLPKPLIALSLFIALALAPAYTLRAQWVRTNGPYGVLPSNLGVIDSIVFAGNTTIGGIAALNRNSKKWQSTTFSLPFNRYLMTFATIGSKLLVGVDSGITGSEGNSIYASTDEGVHWSLSSTGLTDNSVQCFAVNDSFVFAGSYEHGVFRSSDSGATWAPATNGIGDWYIISLVAIPGYIFAGTEGGMIFRSSNNGILWTEVDSTLPFHYESEPAFLFTDSGRTLLASIYNVGVFLSTDLGISWHSANSGMTGKNVTKILRCGSKLVAATNGGVFLSTDDGTTWVLSDQGLNNQLMSDVALRDSTLFVSSANGIFCSTDTGRHWKEIDSGLTYRVQTNALLKDGINLFAGTQSGIYVSTNDGFSWSQQNSGLTDIGIEALAIIHSAAGPILFAGTNSGPFRSMDYGTSWSLVDSGFPNFPSDNPDVYSFATIDTVLFAAAGYGDFVCSTNYGSTWRDLLRPTTALVLTLSSNGSLIFAGGIYNMEDATFLSTAHDLSLNVLSQLSVNDHGVNALIMDTDAFGAVRLYVDAPADAYGGLAVSTDLGNSWKPFNEGLDSLDADFISSFDNCGSFLLAGSPRGFYFTSSKRDKWTKFNSGLSDSNVHSITSTNSNIFIGTDSGVWRRPLSEMINRSSVAQMPVAKSEICAHPNPLSQSTQITFTPETAGHADITILNLLGIEVAHLFSGELEAGEHSFTWSPNASLPDGMYECLVRMNGAAPQRLPMMLRR